MKRITFFVLLLTISMISLAQTAKEEMESKQRIDLICELNPNVQIILTTHSPAVVMNGWVDSVTEVSDIEV